MYEVKVFIGDKEVKKIDKEQKKEILEKALSTFYKRGVKITHVK